jgi:membrane associated rhomboid family serine protease
LFFPVGLGNWPRIFPFSIFIIAAICIAWSLPYFKAVKVYENYAIGNTLPLTLLKLKVIDESCPHVLTPRVCITLMKTLNTKVVSQSDLLKSTDLELSKRLENVSTIGYEVEKAYKFMSLLSKSHEQWPQEAKQAKSYPEYVRAYNEMESGRRKIEKGRGFLTFETLNFARLVRASFTHSGWMHLISNLIVLIIFGLAVEQRMGSGLAAVTFLIGSFVGLSLDLVFSSKSLLGASAGISALMGAFYVYFWRFEMKFIFSFAFLYNRSFYFAVAWTLPVFYFIADFVGVSDNDGVAHLAHVGGLLFGGAVALIDQKRHTLEYPFLYHQEKNIFLKMKRATAPEKMWTLMEEGLAWNVQNGLFLEAFFEVAPMVDFKPNQSQIKKLIAWAKFHLHRLNQKQDLEDASLFLSSARGTLRLDPILKILSWQNILTIADHSTRNRRFPLALELYKYCWPLVESEDTRNLLKSTCETIQNVLEEQNKKGA